LVNVLMSKCQIQHQ